MTKEVAESEMLFFVHIPKTGGSSLKGLLQEVFPDEHRYPSKHDRIAQQEKEPDNTLAWLIPYIDVAVVRELSAERKRNIRFVTGHLPYCVGELFDCKVKYISFFRDPVARTISHLKHARTIMPEFKGKPIEEVYEDPFFYSTAIHNLQTRFFAHELTPELRMAMDPKELTDDDLTRARERIEGLDFIGILDDFDHSVAMLGEHFGFRFGPIEKRRFDSEKCDVPDWLPERIANDNQHDMQVYDFVREIYYQRRGELAGRAA